MKIYTEVLITPHHAGFGMWQRGELQASPRTSWAHRSDLLDEIAANTDRLLPLAEAIKDPEFIALGVEDISGHIYNEPQKLFAIIDHEILSYLGIEESEVADDFFTH